MATIDKIKLSGTTYDIVDSSAIHSLEGYWTSGQTNNAITAATNALAESIAEQHYQTSGDVQNAITAATDPINSVLTAHTANTDIHVTIADKSAWNAKLDAADVEGFFGAVNYDSTSKRINFYNTSTGGTVLGYVDATDFIKDGMVSNVEIKEVTGKGTCLVITFNSDAGKQAIEIPISQIFDASNYYTKTEIDNIVTGITQDIEEATSGKADTSTVEGINNVLTAHTADTTIHVTASDKTTWSGKQDQLVSGTNIKTVGGNSLLGSGDIAFPAGMTAEVSGTTLIFS
jgi:hypothetical protein